MAMQTIGRMRGNMSKSSEKQSAVLEGKLTLEENFAKLEDTIERLEADDISLEDAFTAYSEGMAVLKKCNDQIDRVEKQVLKLTEQGTLEAL